MWIFSIIFIYHFINLILLLSELIFYYGYRDLRIYELTTDREFKSWSRYLIKYVINNG